MKRLIFVCSVLLIFALLTSCGYSSEDSHKGEVALFFVGEYDTFTDEVRDELEDRFDDAGIKYGYYFSSNREEQIKQVASAIKNGAGVVVADVYDNNSESMSELCTICKKEKIPVVFFNDESTNKTVSEYNKAVVVNADRGDGQSLLPDSVGTAHTILKVIDNFVNKRDKLSGIDKQYTKDDYIVNVPSTDK